MKLTALWPGRYGLQAVSLLCLSVLSFGCDDEASAPSATAASAAPSASGQARPAATPKPKRVAPSKAVTFIAPPSEVGDTVEYKLSQDLFRAVQLWVGQEYGSGGTEAMTLSYHVRLEAMAVNEGTPVTAHAHFLDFSRQSKIKRPEEKPIESEFSVLRGKTYKLQKAGEGFVFGLTSGRAANEKERLTLDMAFGRLTNTPPLAALLAAEPVELNKKTDGKDLIMKAFVSLDSVDAVSGSFTVKSVNQVDERAVANVDFELVMTRAEEQDIISTFDLKIAAKVDVQTTILRSAKITGKITVARDENAKKGRATKVTGDGHLTGSYELIRSSVIDPKPVDAGADAAGSEAGTDKANPKKADPKKADPKKADPKK